MSTSAHRLIVLSNARPGMDAELDQWYEGQLDRIVDIPGFEGAQRFRLSDDQLPPHLIPPSPYRYAAVYEVSIPPAEAIPRLLDPALAGPPALDRESERAWWFSAITPFFGSAIESPPHKLIVLSNSSAPELDAHLNEWYDEHLHEVLAMPAGLVNAQRFRLSDDQFPETLPPSEHRYLALYDTDVPPAQTCSVFAEAWKGYNHPRSLDMVSLRDWMYTAVSARRVSKLAVAIG